LFQKAVKQHYFLCSISNAVLKMKEFLKRIGFIDHLTIHLNISREDFVKRLSSVTKEGKIGIFSDGLGSFLSSKNGFIGHVSYEGFRIKKKIRLFTTSNNISIAKGAFSEKNGQLMIEIEINGLDKAAILFFSLPLLFLPIGIIALLYSAEKEKFRAIPSLIIFGITLLSILSLHLRSQVDTFKHELEREFYYLTKNDL
jgi:hypothetical protein